MTGKEAVLAAIGHEEVRPVPYTLGFEESVGKQLDAHYGGAAWRQRLKPYMVGVGAVDTDMKTRLDETRVRDGYGGIWRTDMRPWHLETPPLAEAAFGDYRFPKPEVFFRPEWKAKALERCRQNPESFIIGNLGWGLFERSWNLRGFENALMDAAVDEDFYAAMLDKLMELYLAFVEYTCDLPIDGILFGDDWGDQRGIILGAERWRKFLKPRWARIYAAVKRHGKIVMSHSCGSVAEIIPDLVEIGLDVLESVQPEAANMNPYELKKRFGRHITFWGCLGSQSTIPHGAPEQVSAEVQKLCREMGRGGGYIFAPAKPLQPETPVANAVAMVEAVTAQKS